MQMLDIWFDLVHEYVFLDHFLVLVEKEHERNRPGVEKVLLINGLVVVPPLHIVHVYLGGMDVVVPHLRIILEIDHHHSEFPRLYGLSQDKR